jgi:DNA adenine methylase
MKNKNFSLINIAGSKRRFFDQLFEHFDKSKDVYVEGMFGGGNVYINIPNNTYETYIVSDIIEYQINVFKLLYQAKQDAEEIQHIKDTINGFYSQYDIKNNKEDYYKFREYWNGIKDNPTESYNTTIGFLILANSCINNLVRFGPNGFNQSFGNRTFDIKKLDEALLRIKDKTDFHPFSFEECFKYIKFDFQNTFFYFDPPYTSSLGMYDNSDGKWTVKNDEKLYETCKMIHDNGGTFCVSNFDENKSITELFKDFSIHKLNGIIYKSSVGKHEAKNNTEIIIKNF